ncbi:MAG: HAD family hydrolase [Candidatus Micrarchaeia archaeon]|jgi:HAD superfamily hydrolase (TIGR01509 family)
MDRGQVGLSFDGKAIDGIKLVIFDKDGTITDLYKYWSVIAGIRSNIICRELGLDASFAPGISQVMGLDLANKRFRPEGPIGVKKRTDVLEVVVAFLASEGHGDCRAICEKAFAEADKEADLRLSEMLEVISGVREFVCKLDGRCLTAVATADNTARAKIVLETVGLPAFNLVAGGDMAKKSKPDPEIALIILEKLGVRPEEAVIIGDAPADLQLAANAGLKAGIGVATGMFSLEELKKQAYFAVGNLNEITVL